MKIYYAHHLWKYNTKIEINEIDIIKKSFPSSQIINPNKSISQFGDSIDIMKLCLDSLSDCNILIFSAVNGIIGRGVFREIERAEQLGMKIYYIFYGELLPNYKITINDESKNKEYAKVEIV